MFEGFSLIYILMLLIFFAGALFSLLANNHPQAANIISHTAVISASVTGLFLSSAKLVFFSQAPFSFTCDTNLYPFSFSIYIDNLSAFFVLTICLLSLLVAVYSLGYVRQYDKERKVGILGFLFNLFILSMILVVTAGQLFFFLVVWEIMSLVSYFLVVYEGEKQENQKAGTLYIIMTHMGTACIIAAFVLLYLHTGQRADFAGMDASHIPVRIKHLIFILTLLGFGTKAGILPLHVWLPSAHPAAPSHVSALMSGLMIKTAVYGMIRFILGILGGQYLWWGTVLLILGAISTVLGIAYALMEINIKRLLAYSSVENIGMILVGLGISVMAKAAGHPAVAVLALTASVLHVFNHALFKGLLFLGAGAVHLSTKTKNMEELGGLIRKMPYTAVFFLVGSLSVSALPPFNGFVSEWLLYQSLFHGIQIVPGMLKLLLVLAAAVLAMAGVLAAYSFIKTFGIAFLALPRSNAAREAREVSGPMLAGMGGLSVLCAGAGIFPLFVLRLCGGVPADILKSTAINSFSGISGFIVYPASLDRPSLSPLLLLLLFAALAAAVYRITAFLKKGAATRVYGTWDCGYIRLNPRMQYSATGFSKPLRIVFRGIFRPQRELQIGEGQSPYFFKSAKYIVSTQSVIEKYIYEPTVKGILHFARKTRLLVQTGSIHTYLIYIFIVIIGMFVYYVKA